MRDIWNRLCAEFKDEDARREYADEFLDTMISLQIRALRQERKWNQKQFGDRVPEGMEQQQVSLLESADYSSWTITTLKRLAAAFDLRLRVTFESFGSLRDDLLALRRQDLQRPSFGDDPAFTEVATGEEASEPAGKEWSWAAVAASSPSESASPSTIDGGQQAYRVAARG